MGRLIRTGGDNLSIFIDAEEQNRLEMSLSVLEATVRAHRPKNIGIAVQAYSRR
jgi:proline dehydrogenase